MSPPFFSIKEGITMYKEIEIGNKKIGMLANGLSPVLFNRVFHADFFSLSSELGTGNEGATVDTFSKMGFIMAKQAEKKDLTKINEDQFWKWLEGFDPMDIPNAIIDIVDLYMSQTKGTATAKK